MKKQFTFFGPVVLCIVLVMSACKKDSIKDDRFGFEDADIILAEGFSSTIVSPLVKPADFPYYTKGAIEYSKNGSVLALVNFGNGELDNWATKTINGVSETFDLSCSKKSKDYKKVIIKPLIKIEGCDYIVEGIIQYFKDDKWVATVDYGAGSCDEWAFKTWDGGSKTISLKK